MLRLKQRRRKETKRTYWTIQGTGPDGIFYRESLGANSRAEAEAAFERRKAEIVAHANRTSGDDLPVADVILYYLETPDPETGKEHDPRFTDVIVMHLGEMRVSELTTAKVHDKARVAYPEGKPQTINRQFIAPLSAAIRFAHERGKCPMLAIKRLKESKPAERAAVDQAWIAAFCRAAVELGFPELAAMELFMATTGARRGSCFDLDWKDVDLDKRVAILRDTKTGDDVTAYLVDGMVAALAAISRPEGGLAFRVERDGHGKPFRSFYRRWAAICKHAGIPYVPPHQSGRHTFATEMIINNKVDTFTTAALAGWKSTKMLEKYVHAQRGRQVVDAAFKEVPSIGAPETELHQNRTKDGLEDEKE